MNPLEEYGPAAALITTNKLWPVAMSFSAVALSYKVKLNLYAPPE